MGAPLIPHGAGDPPATGHAPTRRARTWWWVAGALGLVLVGILYWLGQQSERTVAPAPRAFCRTALRLEDEFERHGRARPDRQLTIVEDLAAAAPRRIRADATTYLDAMRRVRTDPSVVDDPDVERAVDNVNRYASQGCGFFERRGGP